MDFEKVYEEDVRELFEGTRRDVGFGENPSIVVVDLQTGFTDPDSPMGSDMDDTVKYNADLLQTARKNDVPIFFVRSTFRSDGKDGAVFAEKVPKAKILTDESRWLKIDPRLNRSESEPIIDKQAPSAFFNTNLNTMLNYENTDTVIVTGVSTSECIRSTVVDSISYGYRTIVPIECVVDRAEEPHRINLFHMKTYADLMSLEDVKERLSNV